ncbi:MAG TPA: DUF2723 domain-containing protein [Vicinamibacterales bacterium]|nr:DUF2723 domain-containing protein [Vicinamibacterales bacterium]
MRAPDQPTRQAPDATTKLVAAAVIATIAFWAYTQTLLPGVDLGDTGGFQAAVLWPAVSARQAYPLYYGLAKPFVAALSLAHPARGLNLFSAVWGAIAIGLLTWVVADIAASVLAGMAAGLLFAFSFTFWTQAIIAEVYTLHLAIVGCCLAALLAYAARPNRWRLALFFAIYAGGFGNHLSMIVLLVPFAAFLFAATPRARDLLRPAVIIMAIVIAVAGALQYTPNFLSVWSALDAPASVGERLASFWFDTTKADWREEMVFGIGGAKVAERLAMWFWDARQQFGIAGLLVAIVGAGRIWWISRPWAIGLWLAYAFTTAFAFTYNVGDSHVFFLPSHYFTAIFLGIAAASDADRYRRAIKPPPAANGDESSGRNRHPDRGAGPSWSGVLAVALIAYAGWRAWDTWPAVDRHNDHRAETLVANVTRGADESHAVIATDMDWQAENALLYSSRWEQTNVAWVRLAEVLPHFPFFVDDNHAIDRDVILTANAATDVTATYGSLYALEPVDMPSSLAAVVAAIPRGAPYVLTRLKPTADNPLDVVDYSQAVAALSNNRITAPATTLYEVIAGLNGDAPALHQTANRPFRMSSAIAGDRFDIRMESWLPDDTFRRAGFGQVIRGHTQVMIVERGVSLVWFSASAAPRVAYAAGLYAPQPRFRILRATLHFARDGRPEGRPLRLSGDGRSESRSLDLAEQGPDDWPLHLLLER